MNILGPSVFISYSHADASLLRHLLPYLKALEREEVAEIWVDTGIMPGGSWRSEIEAALDAASVAVLLISQSFLVSQFIYAEELPRILRRQQERQLEVLPVFLSPSSVASTSIPFMGKDGTQQRLLLTNFQGVASPSKTIRELSRVERERRFVALHDRIRELARVAQKKSASAGANTVTATRGVNVAEVNRAFGSDAHDISDTVTKDIISERQNILAPRAIILDRHYAYQLTSYSNDPSQQQSNQLSQKYYELFDVLTVSVMLFDVIYLEQHHVSSIESALSEEETEASLDLFTPISLAEPVGPMQEIAALEEAIAFDLKDRAFESLISHYHGRRPVRPANNRELVVYINTVLHHAKILRAAIMSRPTRMPLFGHKCKVEHVSNRETMSGASWLTTISFDVTIPKLRRFGDLARLQEEPSRDPFRVGLWERLLEAERNDEANKAFDLGIAPMAYPHPELSKTLQMMTATFSTSRGPYHQTFLTLQT